ncbi:hypothetical protein VTI74DRAFT_11027 [Chaetomium olivicolor]
MDYLVAAYQGGRYALICCQRVVLLAVSLPRGLAGTGLTGAPACDHGRASVYVLLDRKQTRSARTETVCGKRVGGILGARLAVRTVRLLPRPLILPPLPFRFRLFPAPWLSRICPGRSGGCIDQSPQDNNRREAFLRSRHRLSCASQPQTWSHPGFH